MASEWRPTTWGDEISLEYGKAIRGYSEDSGKYRVFGSNGPIGWHSEYLTTGPGVILGRKGAYRGVKFSKEPFFVIDTAYYVRPKTSLDVRWMYYAIIHHRLGEIDDGSPIPSTTRAAVYVRNLNVPPMDEQIAIAAILGSIDDRIETIEATNNILERIARAIFKSWFVDFDPVRAKADGREPEGMDAATAALFPNEFDGSEHGPIPSGWHYAHAGDLMRQLRESLNPSRHPEEMFDHFSLPAFDEGKRPKSEYGSEIRSNKTVVPLGCILLSKLNPHIPRVWLPNITSESHAICSTEFLVLLPEKGISPEYLFCQFTEPGFAQEFVGLTTGTSNSHQRVKVDYLMEHSVLKPQRLVVEAFTSIAQPIFDRAKADIEMQQTLAALRDALLPRLMSGNLRVPEAEKMVEAVL